MDADTPVSLLERLRRPEDAAAWERFVHLYTPLLYHWARRTGLQQADADDLVQEVFAVLVRELPRFRYDRARSFHKWLKTITLNLWRDRARRAASRPAGPQGLEQLAEPEGLQTFVEEEYRAYLVRRALQVMQTDFQPATWQACWEMVVANRPAAAVAAELGLSVGAVHAARFRVLARLRQELDGLLE